jgi:hypothetical protein
MTVRALSNDQVDLTVGQVWQIIVEAEELPILVILLPDGSALSPAVTFEQVAGYERNVLTWGNYAYVAELLPAVAGRYIASASTTDGANALFQAWVGAVTPNTSLPDADELSDWLGGSDAHSYTDEELTQELAAASAAQRRVCRIPAAYPDDLREALMRRAARLLYMRRQLTALPRDEGDFGLPASAPPGRDYTTKDLEAPWRKIVVG